MSNASKFVAVAVAVRAAGSKNTATGTAHGGVYYPEHILNGKTITARFEANVYINGMDYTDPLTGERKEGRNDTIRIVAWNGRNSKPGAGLADLCAKAITKGKEFSCELDVRTFDKRLLIDNKPQVDHLGREIIIQGINFHMKGLPIWGNDADAIIKAEINNYRQTGQATFASRPPFWNVAGHPDAAIWDVIKKSRREAQYVSGSTTYGHARVVVPTGAQLLNAGGNAASGMDMTTIMAMIQTAMSQTAAPVIPPTPVAPVAPVVPTTPAGIDPAMMATILAQMQAAGGASTATNVPPVTAAAGSVLNGQMPI